jgi:DNA-binding transcriptional regulator GbsR (MarR family)
VSVVAATPRPHRRADGVAEGVSGDAEIRSYVQRFAGVLTAAGLPRMPALVFVALYTADAESMTAADLAEHLDVSLASISAAVRFLTPAGIIVRERPAGHRQDRFRVDDDVWLNIMKQRDVALAAWQEQISDGIRVTTTGSPAHRRLEQSLPFFDFMRRELTDMLARWEAETQGS